MLIKKERQLYFEKYLPHFWLLVTGCAQQRLPVKFQHFFSFQVGGKASVARKSTTEKMLKQTILLKFPPIAKDDHP